MGFKPRDERERFWEKVGKAGPTDCWPWLTPSRDRKGYGYMSAKRGWKWRTMKAHRLAWEYAHGPIPAGLHHCDNPSCCKQVLEMRRRWDAGGVTKVALAVEYGVTDHAVRRIVKRLNWRHLDGG